MHAVRVESPGGREVLTVAHVEAPAPPAGEVLVDVTASGVNFMDVYQREGIYGIPLPNTLGVEGAGRVAALGEGVSGVAVGDRVAWANVQGSYAEQVVVPADRLVPVPEGVDDETAAAVLLQGMTAQFLTRTTWPVTSGDVALVTAAAGGVGLLLTQMITLLGGRVLAVTSTPEKAELARAAGADEVLSYDTFTDEAKRLTGGRGVDVVYDSVGRSTFDASLASLRRRGMMVLYGASSGAVPPVDPQALNRGGSLFLTRPGLPHHIAERSELVERSGEVFRLLAEGRLSVRIGARYPLADVVRAHEDLESRRTTGKLLLLP